MVVPLSPPYGLINPSGREWVCHEDVSPWVDPCRCLDHHYMCIIHKNIYART